MAKGSVLKNLKADLQKNDLLRGQKRKKEDKLAAQQRRERDQRALASIREAFNPFSAKFNRAKSAGGGREKAGRPLAARSQAELERQRTWEAEKKLRNKVGGIVDRRFGEKDKTLSEEDRMAERFAREKLNRMRKSRTFNIEHSDGEEETEVLTHGGQRIEFTDDFEEKFDDEELGDDLNGEPKPKRTKTDHISEEAEEEAQPERPKTKAEIMQEVIAKSKMHKLERQQQKAKDEELTNNLNAGFDELMAELGEIEDRSRPEQREVDDYDTHIQEFAFEKRADPSDRTKTPEELAEEAAERKRQAERAQQARMEGDELDVDYDNAVDDADLFGLKDIESESDAGEAELEAGTEAAAEQAQTGPAPALALVSQACKSHTSSEFAKCVKELHESCPRRGVGLAVANKCRDMVSRAHKRPEWGRPELLLFALIGSLFSTSDQWHVVATSASLCVTQRLSQSVEINAGTVSKNLFLMDVLLDYQRLSKRYFPEIPCYLLRVLCMLGPIQNSEIAERLVRIPKVSKEGCELSVRSKVEAGVEGVCAVGSATTPAELAVITAKLCAKAASLWRSLESFKEIFEPLVACLRNIPSSNSKIDGAIDTITRLAKFSERAPLKLQEFRPVGIVSRVPLFDENYNPEKKGYGLDGEARELRKLRALHKKERKSTLREIRRDTEFEARQELSERRKEMEAYHARLKQLEGQINGEEGRERNAYEREKKKRSRR